MKKIEVKELKQGMQLSRPVKNEAGTTLMESCIILNEDSIDALEKSGINDVYIIETADLDENVKVMEEFLEKGFRSTRERTLAIAKIFLERIAVGKGPDDVETEASLMGIMGTALQDANILVKLSGVNAVDNYLYSHSVNTAVLSLLIAKKMGFKETELLEMAKSALMADVGMMLVPATTWEHEGPLTEEQRRTVQKHVVFSRQILEDLGRATGSIIETVHQHHERCDGSGYPLALSGEKIRMSARVLAVADVFAAIREPRSYRVKSGPVRALKAITSSQGFYPDVLRMFLATVSVYPVQSYVRLNSGAIGMVVKVKENNPFRPTVEIIRNEKGRELKKRRKVDLMEEGNFGLFIEEALDELPE